MKMMIKIGNSPKRSKGFGDNISRKGEMITNIAQNSTMSPNANANNPQMSVPSALKIVNMLSPPYIKECIIIISQVYIKRNRHSLK